MKKPKRRSPDLVNKELERVGVAVEEAKRKRYTSLVEQLVHF